MLKFIVALALVGMMFAFTGCDKPKAEIEKAIVTEQAVYAQDSEQAVKTEKAEVKKEAVKEEAKAEKAKPAKKAKKADKAAKK